MVEGTSLLEIALEWLNGTVNEYHPWVALTGVHPAFAFLSDDPRFQDLLLWMNLMP